MSSTKSGKASDGSAPQSLSRSISPPAKRRRVDVGEHATSSNRRSENAGRPDPGKQVFGSPFQLTKIQDLSGACNADTVALHEILGDPLISECWNFNYLHDISFLKGQFDKDTRDLVDIHVIHGFWKSEDPNRKVLEQHASMHQNVTLHTAYLSEPFGTHHTKMLVLFRRDDTAQVVIHTANMIVRDWRNMTQAVWKSPMLPLLGEEERVAEDANPAMFKLGSGAKFKRDLLNYFRAYDDRRVVVAPLSKKLANYDFSAVRGALIASIPGRHKAEKKSDTRWGWTAMLQALREIPAQQDSEVVVQVSSIATLGQYDTWVRETFFPALSASKESGLGGKKPKFKVMFPTPDEIRRSLDGYESGGSIHTKIQKPQQVKQLAYLRPFFHHWANDAADGVDLPDNTQIQDAGRQRAAPHIKTYVRRGTNSIDWALVTSANLSKQAWGEATGTKSGQVRICSFELGVLVWPGLYAEDAVMKPTFKTDQPVIEGEEKTVVGFRMPYSWPLQRYGPEEKPWVATMGYDQSDWKGQIWRAWES